jgi:hypothetical protein
MSPKKLASRKPQRRGSRPVSLPPVSNSITFSKRFRFVADADQVDIAIDYTCIRNLIGIAYHSALPSNGLYRMIDAFRIRAIDLYAVPEIGTVTSVAIDWTGTNTQRSNRVSDTSLGISPAHVHACPPANSWASMWVNQSSATTLFSFTVPVQGVLDLSLDLVLVDTGGAYTSCTDTVTDGAFYVKHLDTVLGSYQGHMVPLGYSHVLAV